MKRIHSCLLAGMMFCVANSPLFGQEQELKSCGTNLKLKELYAKHPELEIANEELLRNSKQFKQNRDGSIRTVYTIPLVFHIIHEYGSENISDSQVYDQVAILNRDYRKLNADTSDVVPEFDTLIADCNLEFRLATKDFQGNCTNGIEHIYSHETNNGDDYSKLYQWPRSKYLNVWVVKTMENGVAGYAYYPTSVEGFLAFADGVIILQNYIGSIGTSAVGRSRALTHEIGHYLGLSHPWGSTNDPMVQCGDDGMDDTPVTRGFNFCPGSNYQTTAAICTPGVVENFQNYMDYSYCSRMFTPDQSNYMNYTLQDPTAERNNLVTIENHAETGIDVSVAPVCVPVADFHPEYKYVCSGEAVNFYNNTWRATPDTYSWSFPTGTPSTSSAMNPSVIFNSPGYHQVSLTVTNAAGTNTKTELQSVWVSYPWVDNIGPHSEDFESGTADDWLIDNPENNTEKWELVSNGALSGAHCYRLKNYYSGNSSDPFYQNRLGGNRDALISPAFDLSNTSSATLTFNYSCATSTPSTEDMTDALRVYSSVDCGKNWVLRKTISGVTLMTGGYTGSSFLPNNSNQWDISTVNLGSSVLQPNVRFKFEFTSSDYSNNIYLDNININGVLGTEDLENNEFAVRIFPNPVDESQNLFIQCENEMTTQVSINDITGKVIYSTQLNKTNPLTIQCKEIGLTPGVYFINFTNEKSKVSKKLVVL